MKFYLILFAITTFFMSGCQKSETIFVPSHYPKKANAPFSDIVKVDNLLFLAGQIGMDHNSRTLVEGGIQAETKQAIQNIEEVLKLQGAALKDVVKCTVILSDINDFKAFNEVYVKCFPNKPARTTFAASGLAVGAKIEIDCIAVVP